VDATLGSRGRLLRDQIASWYAEPPATPTAPDVLLGYRLMGTVHENWIPLVSVRLDAQVTSTAFLRGASGLPFDQAILRRPNHES
jgi:hypothetical protein